MYTAEDIRKYPMLAKSVDLQKQCNELATIQTSKQERSNEIDKLVESIQKTCNHKWRDKTHRDEHFAAAHKSGGHIFYGATVLDSRTCTECGLTETRPKGEPWVICHVCWSPMKYEETIPGQSERHMVYECTNENCNHASWHT